MPKAACLFSSPHDFKQTNAVNLVSEAAAATDSVQCVVRKGSLQFPHPALSGHNWPVLEVIAPLPGPRVCVMAGMHVNEVCGIEAAFRLADALPGLLTHGQVSIVPFVNMPALSARTEYYCPVDGKNINWQFPGDLQGSFSEQLADALLNHWVGDADLLIDLHGGDLREDIASFVMFQETADEALNARNRSLAECFDVAYMEPLRPKLMEAGGRACTGRGRLGKPAVMSEAGANGLLDEDCVAIHYDGVLRILNALEMTGAAPAPKKRQLVEVRDRAGVEAPASGFLRTRVEIGEHVEKGQIVADIRDRHGCVVQMIEAPISGITLFKISHPLVNRGERIMSFVHSVTGA
ncbi:succinylglutamate desuccinylase/aspartoacylase family protein [Mesorhizobium sp. Z1-4]|uniref:succinylglutamate desuccinylase/aspartoacylase family protein n=1 Tax=Mesorhizobium sp. Z1-4 TaxID=2448478 RepID=UPI000FD9E26A|nr:succinylglutamate desuccinylase/aspartoacylase family protein [Mesorhizobium sp. Z1-4]